MEVYLVKKQIFTTPTEKETVFMFNISPSFGAKEIETKTEPKWWRTFPTEEQALQSLIPYLNK